MKDFYVEPSNQITCKGTIDAFGLKCLVNRYFAVKRHISKIEQNIQNCPINNEFILQEFKEDRARYVARRYELENVLALFGVDAQSLEEEPAKDIEPFKSEEKVKAYYTVDRKIIKKGKLELWPTHEYCEKLDDLYALTHRLIEQDIETYKHMAETVYRHYSVKIEGGYSDHYGGERCLSITDDTGAVDIQIHYVATPLEHFVRKK